MLRLEELSIGYKGKRGNNRVVASGLSATLKAAQMACLVGQNGVGKSTLIRTIAGFIPPISGIVRLNGQSQLRESEISKLLSVVLTDRPAMSGLTVFDVVSFGRIPYSNLLGRISEEDKSIVMESIAMVGIKSLKERYFEHLSDGEKQKVMIAKSLAQQTPIIVLDEPSAFLDYQSKRELMSLLSSIATSEQKAILISSHDLDVIQRYANSFWIMERREKEVQLRTSHSIDYLLSLQD